MPGVVGTGSPVGECAAGLVWCGLMRCWCKWAGGVRGFAWVAAGVCCAGVVIELGGCTFPLEAAVIVSDGCGCASVGLLVFALFCHLLCCVVAGCVCGVL